MDFAGQGLAERMYETIITFFSGVAFVAGYATGSFRLMMEIFATGVALSLLLCVPSWPFLRRHPLKWLKKPEGGGSAEGAAGARGKPPAKAKSGKRS